MCACVMQGLLESLLLAAQVGDSREFRLFGFKIKENNNKKNKRDLTKADMIIS